MSVVLLSCSSKVNIPACTINAGRYLIEIVNRKMKTVIKLIDIFNIQNYNPEFNSCKNAEGPEPLKYKGFRALEA